MTPPSPPSPKYVNLLAALTALTLAALQLLLFVAPVSSGQAVDFGLIRADGVGLVFGTTWALAIALAALRATTTRQAASILLLLAGLLAVAYAREPLTFYAGWEVATAALWLTLPGKTRFGRFPAAMHLAGLPLLVAIFLGLIPPFAPPPGGAAEPWHPALLLVFAAITLLRIWLALPTTPTHHSSLIAHRSPLIAHLWLYALAAPILLVKALVAAPLGPLGIWMVALASTFMLLTGSWLRLTPDTSRQAQAIGWIWTGCIVAALGLASGAPLAAAGAVWLMLVGAGLAPSIGDIQTGTTTHRTAGIIVAMALPGIWLIAQAALDLRYGLVAALLLPCLLFALEGWRGTPRRESTGHRLPAFIVALALTIAAYPQLPLELAIRPAVQAMAGGVGALSTLTGDWGVGLLIRPQQTALSAGLPATGMMLALFLAFVTLYWLKRILDFGFWILDYVRSPNPKSGGGEAG